MTGRTSTTRRSAPVVCIGLIITLGVGCGGSDGASTAAPSEPMAWARPTPVGANSGIVYVTRTSGLDDAIVSAKVADDIAATVSVGDTNPGHTHGDGHIGHLDRPPEVPGAATPTGEPVLLSGLKTPLAEGQHFPLKVSLASGTSIDVDVAVSATQTKRLP